MRPRNPKCPQCDSPLVECPRHSKWMNDEQYASVKAGDWYCETCPSNDRGQAPLCYWTDREVEQHEAAKCEAVFRS